jgi:hypothetical protein
MSGKKPLLTLEYLNRKIRELFLLIGSGTPPPDGDKGDITVSGSGTSWSIDNDSVTNNKLANMANSTFKGRVTGGTGDAEDLSIAQAKSLLNLANTNTGDEDDASLGAVINASASATPNNTDLVATAESGGVLKKITWTNVKAFLKTYFDTIYTATFSRKINGVTFDGSADIVTEALLKIASALGGSIKSIHPFGFSGTTSSGLLDNRCYFQAVWLPEDATITGVSWIQSIPGNYTADGYNGVGLYTYSGGTLTLVASSTNDGNIWKPSIGAWGKKDFSTPYVATAGLYFIGALYCQSAQTTAPNLAVASAAIQAGQMTQDFTNSAKLSGFLNSQTSLPSSQASSGLGADPAPKLFALY